VQLRSTASGPDISPARGLPMRIAASLVCAVLGFIVNKLAAPDSDALAQQRQLERPLFLFNLNLQLQSPRHSAGLLVLRVFLHRALHFIRTHACCRAFCYFKSLPATWTDDRNYMGHLQQHKQGGCTLDEAAARCYRHLCYYRLPCLNRLLLLWKSDNLSQY
jgi:hypothetical protein